VNVVTDQGGLIYVSNANVVRDQSCLICDIDMNAFIDQGCLIYILDVAVVRDGWCDKETEMREQVKNIVMAVVSHFIKEYRNKLIAEGVSEGFLKELLQLGKNSLEEIQ
jgi:hypothetical protein